jgi:hypothetical protein
VVAVDGVRYDAVTSEVMHCPTHLAVPLVSFSSDIGGEKRISIPIAQSTNDLKRRTDFELGTTRAYLSQTVPGPWGPDKFFTLAYFELGSVEIAELLRFAELPFDAKTTFDHG